MTEIWGQGWEVCVSRKDLAAGMLVLIDRRLWVAALKGSGPWVSQERRPRAV